MQSNSPMCLENAIGQKKAISLISLSEESYLLFNGHQQIYTSGQPQVKLSLLRSISLKIRPLMGMKYKGLRDGPWIFPCTYTFSIDTIINEKCIF
jgi:hypothetical protein